MDYSEYAEFDGNTDFSCFRLKIPFLGKFGPKKLKLSVYTETKILIQNF